MLKLTTIEAYNNQEGSSYTPDIMSRACGVIASREVVGHQLINILLENSECRLYVLHCMLVKEQEISQNMGPLCAQLLSQNPEIELQVNKIQKYLKC